MRKTLAALLIAAAIPTAAFAMPDKAASCGPDSKPGMHQKGFHGKHHDGFRGLDLTREQRQDIGRIMSEQRKAQHEIHQRYLDKLPQKDRDAMQKEMRDNRDKRQQEIRAKLTPEQQKHFDDMRKKMEERQTEWSEFKEWKAGKAKGQ